MDYDVNSDTVFLCKGKFYDPVEIPDLARARNVIESKRDRPWSEVINGNRPLPQNPYRNYIPHDSFDSNGFLKQEALEAADQSNVVPVIMSPEDKLKREKMIERQRSIDSTANVILADIIEESLSSETERIGSQVISEMQREVVAAEVVQDLTEEFVTEFSREVGNETLKTLRNEELEKRLAFEAKMAECEVVRDDLVKELVDEMVMEIGKQEMVLVEKQKRLEKCFELAKDLIEDIISNVVQNGKANLNTHLFYSLSLFETFRMYKSRQFSHFRSS